MPHAHGVLCDITPAPNDAMTDTAGTGTVLYNKDCKDQVISALSVGFNSLDGAQVYGACWTIRTLK